MNDTQLLQCRPGKLGALAKNRQRACEIGKHTRPVTGTKQAPGRALPVAMVQGTRSRSQLVCGAKMGATHARRHRRRILGSHPGCAHPARPTHLVVRSNA